MKSNNAKVNDVEVAAAPAPRGPALQWEVQVSLANGVEITRHFRACELKLGSSGNAQVFIPGLDIGALFTATRRGSEFEIKGSQEIEMKVAGKWSKRASYKGAEMPALRVGSNIYQVGLRPAKAKSPFAPVNWGKDFSIVNGPKAVWHFKQGQLLETVYLDSPKGKKRLSSGLLIQWNFKRGAELSVIENRNAQRVELSENSKGSLEGAWNDEQFLITGLPAKDSLAPSAFVTRTEVPSFEWSKFKIGLVAFWVLFFVLNTLIPRSDDELEKPVESVKIEHFGTDMPMPKAVNHKNPGGNGKRGGGGVEHVKTKDPRGGSGHQSLAKKSTQAFKAAKHANAGGNKSAKSANSGGAHAKQKSLFNLPVPMQGGVNSALAKLDSGVRTGKAGSGAQQMGGGKDLVGRDGVLGSLNSMRGTPGGGGLGIGGVGTKGFGGGGGGGRGAGFGTGIGDGLGEGHGRRQLSFGGNGTIVRGGLEKSEIDRVVQENMSQVRYCFNKRLRSNPNLQGKVVTSFTIGASGRVVSTRMKDSSLAAPDVDACILERIATWQFPKPRGGGEVSATVPFLLRAN